MRGGGRSALPRAPSLRCGGWCGERRGLGRAGCTRQRRCGCSHPSRCHASGSRGSPTTRAARSLAATTTCPATNTAPSSRASSGTAGWYRAWR
eukprot:3316704-Rhodomonas_salina.2